jgi:hypothetical protein
MTRAGVQVPGVTCSATLNPDNHRQVVYYVNITATGAYRFHFNAKDEYGRVSFLQQEIKVDLEDPVLALPIGPFEVNGGSSVVLSASIATDASGAPLHDDMLVDYDWDLNNDNIFEVTDEQPTFDAANITGPATIPIQVKVTDRAGRTATAPSEVHVLYVGPMVTIDGAPATSPEGTAINLTSNLVSLNVIDNDGGVGSTSQTIAVTNVAPALRDVAVTPGTVDEGGSVTLSGSVSDPGSRDTLTLTINWGDGSDPEDVLLAAGSPSFSRSHTYADDNPTGTASDTNNISLSLKDKDGVYRDGFRQRGCQQPGSQPIHHCSG